MVKTQTQTEAQQGTSGSDRMKLNDYSDDAGEGGCLTSVVMLVAGLLLVGSAIVGVTA